ncbi:putative galactinol--sucrose galactosyltransferase 2 [Cinnamomum micranthum f. kanehirae]|uniref:galactinol--sucrose galactosyltransferase n=1 Tax=Cinnamomum micranthum f. kanehirae TaxID=337451 RepID=A0A3S3N351_9MAGN|nr:putative galactinol--sucrose galactosyltransferase 2 [Cinnamomum micranthum f. kanehirae]
MKIKTIKFHQILKTFLLLTFVCEQISGHWRSTRVNFHTVQAKGQMPEMLDWFGWCTWDAFYTEVNPQGIENGLKSLSEGGTPARFLIIDDGWQDTVNEFVKEGEPSVDGFQCWNLSEVTQIWSQISQYQRNKKFCRTADTDPRGTTYDLNDFVSTIKQTFGLKYVYVWHSLMGC